MSDLAQVPDGWSGDAESMWLVVMLTSMLSPLLVWILLPFLRGEGTLRDGCFGITRCSRTRIAGICGTVGEDQLRNDFEIEYLYL